MTGTGVKPEDWSTSEVESVVEDYFRMLDLELRGVPYNKSEHRRMLRRQLNNRSDGSVERKHSNISAVLVELGFPYLRGYKPQHHYQLALVEAVARRLSLSTDLELEVSEQVVSKIEAPKVNDILALCVDAPTSNTGAGEPAAREAAQAWRARRGVDYLEREARNQSLGRAGEELVVDFEMARLRRAGLDSLAARVDHVSLTCGDGLGFDVRSFDCDGRETYIEVKTTGYGILTPFYVSRNELDVSRRYAGQYRIYRLFDFRRDPHLFTLSGSLDTVCALEPAQYVARVS